MDLGNSEMLTGDDNWTLTDLPYEVTEQILSCEGISHVDICRISEVCHKLYDITNSRRLWHTKFCQAWGSLSELYDKQSATDWKENYQQRLKYGKHVKKLVASMCEQANSSQLLDSSFCKFKELSEEYRFASHFMLDEMDYILCDGRRYCRLTTKFHCARLLHFARQHHLKKVFSDFFQQYENCHQPLDIGATLISQYCKPVQRIDYKDISKKLDDIAQNVKEAVKQSSPKHPVLLKDIIPTNTINQALLMACCRKVPDSHGSDSSPSTTKQGTKNMNENEPGTTVLGESLWSPSECRVILACLNSTLFDSLLFECMYDDGGFSSHQILIDEVLDIKIGAPIVIAVIYASVAHRLGVLCELCEPSTSTLKWLEHPALDTVNRYTYIDVNACGRFYTAAEFLVASDRLYGKTEFSSKLPSEVFKSVIESMTHIGGRDFHYLEDRLLYESSSLELGLIWSPDDSEKILMLVQLYLHMDTRLLEAKDLLQRVTTSDAVIGYRVERLYVELESRMKALQKEAKNRKPPEKKLRENCPAVLFAIGMIMRHKKYGYTCVIYGWDKVCSASDHWIQQMRVFELKDKNNQPFYNVLVEDGTQRYAAQENLEFCHRPMFITHPDTGKYFDEFRVTHFVPNEVTNAEYPQDASARETMLRDIFSSSCFMNHRVYHPGT